MARLQSSVAFNYGGNGIIQFYGMDQKRAQIDVWTKEEDDIFQYFWLRSWNIASNTGHTRVICGLKMRVLGFEFEPCSYFHVP